MKITHLACYSNFYVSVYFLQQNWKKPTKNEKNNDQQEEMKQNKGVYVTKHKIRDDQKLVYSIYRSDRDYSYRSNENKNFGSQYDSKRDRICTCNNVLVRRHEVRYFGGLPKQVYAYHGSREATDIGVGSVKAVQRRKVRRVYLPERDDTGVGSSDLSSFIIRKRFPKVLPIGSYFDRKKTSSKCVGGILEYNVGCVVSQKLSPFIHTKSGATSPKISLIMKKNTEIGSNSIFNDTDTKATQFEIIQPNKSETKSEKQENKTQKIISQIKYTKPVISVTKPAKKVSEQTQKYKNSEENTEDIKKSKIEQAKPKVSEKIIKKQSEKANSKEATKKVVSKEANKATSNLKDADKTYSSDSLVQHVHNLENPSDEKHISRSSFPDPMENKLEREYRKMFSSTNSKESKPAIPEFKSASILRRRFEALRRGMGKKDDNNSKKKNSEHLNSSGSIVDEPTHKDASVTSDPPSLISRSFSNTRPYDPTNNKKSFSYKKDKTSNNWQKNSTESEGQGVKGMFKLWGKKFNFEEDVYGNRQATPMPSYDKTKKCVKDNVPTKPSKKDREKEKDRDKEKEGKKFFFFKKKSKQDKPKEVTVPNKDVTAGRCEIKDRIVMNIGPTCPKAKPKLPEELPKLSEDGKDILRKTWLRNFLNDAIDSVRSVNVRWNNSMYATSSSTVFELLDSVYKNTGIVKKSQSDLSTTESSYYKSFTKQVNFVQDIEAWMVPNMITDRNVPVKYVPNHISPTKQIPLRIKSNSDHNNNNIDQTRYDQKWRIEKTEAFAHKIEVEIKKLQSKTTNAENKKFSSEYLRIDIPGDFFDTSSDESKQNQSSDELVYNIVEYETNSEIGRIRKAANDFQKGDRLSADIKMIVSVKDSKSIESKILETVIKRPPIKDVPEGSFDNASVRCDVIGVGIITQRDLREVQKPILKIRDETTDEDSEPVIQLAQKKCEFAESYLHEYCRHLTPMGFELYPWYASDSRFRSSSEKSFSSNPNIDGSKSCPNILEDYATTVITPCETPSVPCKQCTYDELCKRNQNFYNKIVNKFKSNKKTEKPKPKPELEKTERANVNKPDKAPLRMFPKDSIEVWKRRRIYAVSNKSNWQKDTSGQDKTVSVPSVPSRPCSPIGPPTLDECPKIEKPVNVQPRPKNCKRVIMTDCESMNDGISRQMADKPEGILTFKGAGKCDLCKKPDCKSSKHAVVQPYPECEIPQPPCKDICTEMKKPFCDKPNVPSCNSVPARPSKCGIPICVRPPLPSECGETLLPHCLPLQPPCKIPLCPAGLPSCIPPPCHPGPLCKTPPPCGAHPCKSSSSYKPTTPTNTSKPCISPPPYKSPPPCKNSAPSKSPTPLRHSPPSEPLPPCQHIPPSEPQSPSPPPQTKPCKHPPQGKIPPLCPSPLKRVSCGKCNNPIPKKPSSKCSKCNTPSPCSPMPSFCKSPKSPPSCSSGSPGPSTLSSPSSKMPQPCELPSPCTEFPPSVKDAPSTKKSEPSYNKKTSCCKEPKPCCPPPTSSCTVPPVDDSSTPLYKPSPCCEPNSPHSCGNCCMSPDISVSSSSTSCASSSSQTSDKFCASAESEPHCEQAPEPCKSPPKPCSQKPSGISLKQDPSPPPCPKPPQPPKQRTCYLPPCDLLDKKPSCGKSPMVLKYPKPDTGTSCQPKKPDCYKHCLMKPSTYSPQPCPPTDPDSVSISSKISCCNPAGLKPPLTEPRVSKPTYAPKKLCPYDLEPDPRNSGTHSQEPSCPYNSEEPPCLPKPCPPKPCPLKSGLHLKMAPSRKTCDDDCRAWSEVSKMFNVSHDKITIKIKEPTPSTTEIRDPVNIRVEDEDGSTLYERKEYVCDNQRTAVLGDIYKTSKIHRASPITVKNISEDDTKKKITTYKSEPSLDNVLEINLKLRILQGDKTTEVDIGKVDEEKQNSTETKKSTPEVYVLHKSGTEVSEEIPKNDINIKITVRNFKQKQKIFNEKNKTCADNFTKNISDKFHTVSTGYSDVDDDNVFSIHRATINLASSTNISETFSKITDAVGSNQKIDSVPNLIISPQNTETIDIEENECTKLEEMLKEKASEIEKVQIVEKTSELPDFNDTDDQDSTMIGLVTSSEGNDDSVMSKEASKAQKKSLLKKVFQKVGKKTKNKENVRELRQMLKIILTDSSDDEESRISANELAKDVTYTSLKPNFFRDTDSMNNYYKIESKYSSLKPSHIENVYPTEEMNSRKSNSSDTDANDITFQGCMCSKVAEKLNIANFGQIGGCCCRARPKQDEEVSCKLRKSADYFPLNYNTVENVDAETQNSAQNSFNNTVHSTIKSAQEHTDNHVKCRSLEKQITLINSPKASIKTQSCSKRVSATLSQRKSFPKGSGVIAIEDMHVVEEIRTIKSPNDLDNSMSQRISLARASHKTTDGDITVVESIKIVSSKSPKVSKKLSKTLSKRKHTEKETEKNNYQNAAIGIFDNDQINDLSVKLDQLSEERSKREAISVHFEEGDKDILQSYAAKKAVLEIYAEKAKSGDNFVAKLPKLVLEKESELQKCYEQIVSTSHKSVCKESVFIMSVKR